MNQTSSTAVGPDFSAIPMAARIGYGALDLNSAGLASFVVLFAPIPDDPCWRLFSHFWMPEVELRGRLAGNDAFWFEALLGKHVVSCPEGTAFRPFVLQQIAALCAACPGALISGIAFDRWRIHDLQPYLDVVGTSLPEFAGCSVGSKVMGPALEALGRLSVGTDLRCADNPVLTLCFDNAKPVYLDGKPCSLWKGEVRGHIGGAVATLMAIHLSGAGEPKPRPSIVNGWVHANS